MTFQWSDYLITASELLNLKNSSAKEARLRSSISRAYYACHCIARNYLRREGYNLETDISVGIKTGIHNKVIQIFKDSNDKIHQQIGHDLVRLKSHRVKADYYHPSDLNFKKIAPLSLVMAKDIVKDTSVKSTEVKTFKVKKIRRMKMSQYLTILRKNLSSDLKLKKMTCPLFKSVPLFLCPSLE